ncbi:MAG: HAMP domain-containing histidine kinase [Actinomycetota bacterium]|nr:HAMP domain-containing histidine kinase [Actinomycetota bacterium]
MSLRARLLAAFAYTLLIVIVALEVPLATNLNDRVNAEVEAESAGQAQIVAVSAAERLNAPAQLQPLATEAADRLGGPVAIVDGRGNLLAASTNSAVAASAYASAERPELLGALNGEIDQRRRGDSLFTAVPIVRGGRTRGALQLEQDVGPVDSAVREDVVALVGIGALALALGLGVAWILAGTISRPLDALAGVARRMAGGDLAARARPRGSAEQVEVATAFNEMADRLQAVHESQRAFVADASHQLRTPLTGLRLRLEAAEAKAGGAAAEEIAAAERETERLSTVVADLLDLATSEEPAEPRQAGLEQAVSAAASRWRDSAAESAHSITVAEAPEAAVRAGERDLALILDNLIENALKYSPSGSAVEIGWSASDGEAILAVSNEGGPLSDEERELAFERFHRGRRARRDGGTGLGLPIVAALARRGGGEARLVNSGSRVVAEVRLPRAR